MALATAPREPGPDEGRLVGLAQRGQVDARERLARRYRPAAYLLALQMTGRHEDAMDVAQDAMTRFFTRLDRFDPRRPVRPWLLQIVRNHVRDLWRRQRVRRAEPLEDAGRELARQIVDPEPDPETRAAAAELRRRLWKAVASLTERQREILVLRDYHDLSYAEIATVLGIPQGTVMSRLHAARKALRARLGGDPRRAAAGADPGGRP